MFECDVFQLVIFRSGATYEFRRTIYLPSPPAYDVSYLGLIPGPTDEGDEFDRITFDISKQKHACYMYVDYIESGRDLAAIVAFYGADWTHREAAGPTPT